MMRRLTFLFALAPCVGCRAEPQTPAPTPTPIATPTPSTPQTLQNIRLDDPRIDESSGLCASRRNPGLLWTHNDSGDIPRAFLISPQGKTLLTVNVQGAQALDWEDMAASGSGKNAYIYCADIGDNEHKRVSHVVYRFREPQLPRDAAPHQTLSVTCEKMSLSYPDGPHDAETLLVGARGQVWILTKDVGGSILFKAPQSFQNGATVKLQSIGSRMFDDPSWRGWLATGGDISPNGRRLTIITYTRLYEWTLTNNDPATMLQSPPRVYILPKLRQSEGVCYALDGKTWWISSEGTPMPLLQLAPTP